MEKEKALTTNTIEPKALSKSDGPRPGAAGPLISTANIEEITKAQKSEKPEAVAPESKTPQKPGRPPKRI